ncbi:hypothetical protein FB107DRAFT_280518 [Schizophyllum commune]
MFNDAERVLICPAAYWSLELYPESREPLIGSASKLSTAHEAAPRVRDVYTRAEDGVDIDARDGASKISQQLVPLPSAARTKDLALEGGEDATLGATPTQACGGAYVEGRAQEDGLQANYGLPHPQEFRLKHLSSYLAREHDVAPRALDEALYEMYHLPDITTPKSLRQPSSTSLLYKRLFVTDDFENEDCRYAVDPHIHSLRIYDFFVLKSHSHLLKPSIAHVLAQSTLLAHFETVAQSALSSSQPLSILNQPAMLGKLKLKRHEVLKLMRLFRLRCDANLIRNVLDVLETGEPA